MEGFFFVVVMFKKKKKCQHQNQMFPNGISGLFGCVYCNSSAFNTFLFFLGIMLEHLIACRVKIHNKKYHIYICGKTAQITTINDGF